MPEYEFRQETVSIDGDDEDVTVDLPDDAVGISPTVLGGSLYVRYLVPVEDGYLIQPDLNTLPDGGRKASTIVGDPQHPAETARPEDYAVEISDLQEGDRVVIEPEPAEGTDAPERIVGEVTRAEEHTCEMAGDRGEPTVTGETLEVDAEGGEPSGARRTSSEDGSDGGETYVRKGTGTLFVIQEHRTRAGVQDFHHAIAFDSDLRLAGGEDS